MLDTITRGVRYASLVMTFTSLVGAVAMIYIGTEKMFRGLWAYFTGTMPPNAIETAQLSDVFIVHALESLDAFLIAFALISFGFGILFLVFLSHRPETARVPKVLVPDSIEALKASLMQVVLVVLTIYFVRVAWLDIEELDFTLWALPGSILLIAVSARVSGITRGQKKQESAEHNN